MNNVVIAYLWTGQVVVGKVRNEQGAASVEEPLELIAGQGEQGQLKIHMTPYGALFGVLPPIQSLDVDKHVMFPLSDAPSHIVSEYVKATSRIVIPQGNISPLRG